MQIIQFACSNMYQLDFVFVFFSSQDMAMLGLQTKSSFSDMSILH